jgi:hypothetical protein
LKQVFQSRPIVEIQASKPVETMALLDQHDGVEKTSLFGTAVHAVMRSRDVNPEQLAAALSSQGIDVRSVGVVTPSLEDVFLDVVDRVGAAR